MQDLLYKYIEQTYSYCFIANSAVQYSLLVFEIVFTGPVISKMAVIGVGRWEGVGGVVGRWVGGRGWVGWWGWVASQRRAITAIRAQTVVQHSQ